MAWSLGVNESVAEIVYNLPPFPGVRETLQRLQGKSDVIVVSATPDEALIREWAEHEIDAYVALIAGQEMGTKTEHLTITTKDRYPENHVLMLGDSPGDLKAARDVGAHCSSPSIPVPRTHRGNSSLMKRWINSSTGNTLGRMRTHWLTNFRNCCQKPLRGNKNQRVGWKDGKVAGKLRFAVHGRMGRVLVRCYPLLS